MLVNKIKELCILKGTKIDILGKELELGEKAIYKWDKALHLLIN